MLPCCHIDGSQHSVHEVVAHAMNAACQECSALQWSGRGGRVVLEDLFSGRRVQLILVVDARSGTRTASACSAHTMS